MRVCYVVRPVPCDEREQYRAQPMVVERVCEHLLRRPARRRRVLVRGVRGGGGMSAVRDIDLMQDVYDCFEQTTTQEAANDIAAFMVIFFEHFRKFKGRQLHLAGESYGVSPSLTSYSEMKGIYEQLWAPGQVHPRLRIRDIRQECGARGCGRGTDQPYIRHDRFVFEPETSLCSLELYCSQTGSR